jgi:hypothetical protein
MIKLELLSCVFFTALSILLVGRLCVWLYRINPKNRIPLPPEKLRPGSVPTPESVKLNGTSEEARGIIKQLLFNNKHAPFRLEAKAWLDAEDENFHRRIEEAMDSNCKKIINLNRKRALSLKMQLRLSIPGSADYKRLEEELRDIHIELKNSNKKK